MNKGLPPPDEFGVAPTDATRAPEANFGSTPVDEGRQALLDRIAKEIARIRNYTPKVGVFGDSGVGKSSLCNALFGKDVATISDVEACTREPQEILVGAENGSGLCLIDVPGVGEDPKRHAEYKALYKSLLPKLDLVIWAIKADSRQYSTSLDVWSEILEPNLDKCPVVFVMTQAEKIEPSDEFYEGGKKLSEKQKANLDARAIDISDRFGVTHQFIQAVSAKHNLNLQELVAKIVKALPNEKKSAFVREAKEETVTEEVVIAAERGVWDAVKETLGDVVETVKDFAVDYIVKSAPVVIAKVGSWLKSKIFG